MRSVFLSTAPGPAADDVRQVLERHSLAVTLAGDYAATGLTLQGEIRRRIAAADLVVALFSGRPSDSNVLFELGIAVGLGKPTLSLVDDPATRLPIDLAENIAIRRGKGDDRWWPDIAASLASRAGEPKQRRVRKPKPGTGLGAATDDFLRRLDGSQSEEHVAALFQEVLTSAGAGVLSRGARFGAGRPDLAIWMDELHSVTGNPIIFEITGQKTGDHELGAQLGRYLAASGARFAMVLGTWSGVSGITPIYVEGGVIVVLSARETIEALRKQSLSSFIRDVRNRVAHGRH